MKQKILDSATDISAQLIAFAVALHGLFIIGNTLVLQLGGLRTLRRLPVTGISLDIPILAGLALLYVSWSLARRKRTAWIIASGVYIFLLGLNADNLIVLARETALRIHNLELLLPALMLAILWLARKEFVVQSDSRTFANSLRISVLVLSVALLYGVSGFLLMDKTDFHREISLPQAVHYTIDQFDLTTDPLHAFTRRAQLFQNSLTFISISAVGFAFFSLFQPLRARYVHQRVDYETAKQLIYLYQDDSEDFFKLWPYDKTYLLSPTRRGCIAYKATRGVALSVGNPIAPSPAAGIKLVKRFEDLCYVNDWRPAFIHITPAWSDRLKKHGYHTQLIGQEAVVLVAHFQDRVVGTKYFREITNRFERLGYTTELLLPPHSTSVLKRLKAISDEWLERPGRTERSFMMGYFNEAYAQQCKILVAKDKEGAIQAFINLVPTPVPIEANYDMLRSSAEAPGNVNDYLIVQLIAKLSVQGIERLNMGLCPLAGIHEAPDTLINRALRFVYSNGDRFYSFRGLYRFKSKYQPAWSDRYVAYRGNVADFTRVMTALDRAMKV